MINPKARPCDEAAIRSVRPDPNCVARQKFWVLAATILGSAMAFVDESVVNVALPAIETDLKAEVAVIQWLVNAYTLCLASLMLIGGAAGDRLGRRQIFVTGTAIFAVGSLWCGLSPTTAQLIAARALQGVGAALLVPSSLAIIGASIDPADLGRIFRHRGRDRAAARRLDRGSCLLAMDFPGQSGAGAAHDLGCARACAGEPRQ